MQVFVTVKKVGIKINADVNVKNWLTKEYVTGFIWNPSNCECDKSCHVGEYLDYENFNGRKKLVDKLVKECTVNIDEVKIAGIALLERGSKCRSSCTIYVG